MQEFLINKTKKDIFCLFKKKRSYKYNKNTVGKYFLCVGSLWQLAIGYSILNAITNLKSVIYATLSYDVLISEDCLLSIP